MRCLVSAYASDQEPGLGGGILAHQASLAELEVRVSKDPFVAEKVVSAEILEIAVSRADSRLEFLAE